MILDITNFQLFENMLFFEMGNTHYDLHNEYDFEKTIFSNEKLEIFFKKQDISIVMTFLNVEIKGFDIMQFRIDSELVIDNLYRGRFLDDGQLLEKDQLNRNYFYLEFTQSAKLEFFSSIGEVEIVSS